MRQREHGSTTVDQRLSVIGVKRLSTKQEQSKSALPSAGMRLVGSSKKRRKVDSAAQLLGAVIETGFLDKVQRVNLKFSYSVKRQWICVQRPPTRH
jgi:hypothetical protein